MRPARARLREGKTGLLGAAALVLALATGCLKQKESLIIVAVTAEADLTNATTLSISSGGVTRTYDIPGLTQTTPVQRGIYLDANTTGAVSVTATAQGGTPCRIHSKSATVNVAAGAVVNAMLKLAAGGPCPSMPDAGTDTATDSGTDTATDSGTDSGTDIRTDARTDAGSAGDAPVVDSGVGGAGGTAGPSLMTCTPYIHSIDQDCTSNTTVYGVAVSPNGQTVVTGGDDGRAKIWRFNGKTLTAAGLADLPSTASGFGTLAFSPDGSLLAIGWSDGIDLWNTTTWVRVRKLTTPGSVYDVGFTPDGQQIVSIDSTNLYVHNLASTMALHSIAIPESTWLLSVSPIASAGTTTIAVALQDGTVRVFTHSATGFVANSAMLVTDAAGGTTRSVRFSRDGTLLAAGNGLGQLYFWRYPITSPMPLAPIVDVGTPTTSSDVNWLAFSPDNRTIAVAGAYASSVSTFAVAAPRALVGLNRTPTDNLQSITYSPNGAALLAGGVTCGYVLVCAD